jgi:hypothetical protein
MSGSGVVDPVPRPKIDPQFPDSVATRLVIAKVAGCDPVDAALDRHSGTQVLQAVKLTLIGISAGTR